jgi:hypothetical protein
MGFGRCEKCRKLLTGKYGGLRKAPEGTYPKEREDEVMGLCPHCEKGVVFYLSEMDNNEVLAGIKIAGELADLLNRFDYKPFHDGFFLGLTRQHRTLQESVGRLIVNTLHAYGELDDCQYDARNEAFVKLCRKLKPILDEDGCLPFI